MLKLKLKMCEPKAVVCLYGTVNRSISYTWDTIRTNTLEHLKRNGFQVDLYMFNLICDNGLVDNVDINTKSHTVVPVHIYESKMQSDLDPEIIKYARSVPKKISYVKWYTHNQIHNTMRQMYSECRVGTFLRTNIKKYDYAVVCGPDYYLTQKVNIPHLRASKQNGRVYISEVNPGMNGYTNGYYMSGNLDTLSTLLCRYEHILPYLKGFQEDYERLLKVYCESNKIDVSPTDQVFFKIRANKTIFWQGFNKEHKTNPYNVAAYNAVIKNMD